MIAACEAEAQYFSSIVSIFSGQKALCDSCSEKNGRNVSYIFI